MRGHQLFIPGKASEREVQPTYGTDMRAIETAFNALPTGTGTGRPFVRTSRYRVQVTTARTVPIPHSNWFLWDTVHSTLLYQSSVAAPTLSTFITTTTPVQPLHMAGIASRGTAPVVATATWILYITLNISTTRPVDYRFKLTWTYTPSAPVTVPKLIRDTMWWPKTPAPALLSRSYQGTLVSTGFPDAGWIITNPKIHLFALTTIGVGSTVYALFTVVLSQGART